MTTQINQLTELTSTSDGDLLLIRENATGVDKKMQASNLRAKATTKDDVGLGDVDNVSAANLRDRSTHTGTQTLSTISDAGNMALQNKESVNIDGGTIDGTAVNATNLAYTGTLTGGTGIVNLGSGQVFKNASGSVGIGITAPESKLHVSGSAVFITDTSTPGVFLRSGDAGSNGANITSSSLGDIRFTTRDGSNAERMRIDSSGNVGIGTTSPAASLSIAGSNATVYKALILRNGDGSDGSSATIDFEASAGTQGDEAAMAGRIAGLRISSGTSGALTFATTSDGSLGEAMRIDSSGNVGIGTTSPGERLDVRTTSNQNQIRLTDTSGSFGSSYFRQHFSSSTDRGLKIFNDAQTLALYYRTDGKLFCPQNVAITGALSKGSGSFKIDHPLKPESHHLVHSFVEGPQADNLYRGKVLLVNGQATVNIDEAGRMSEGTFEALNCNVQCFTNNESGWTCVRGSVSGNILTIEAQDETCTDEISWMVIGERCDQHMIDTDWTDENGRVITEPEKEQQDAD